jgi:hypothetical protein
MECRGRAVGIDEAPDGGAKAARDSTGPQCSSAHHPKHLSSSVNSDLKLIATYTSSSRNKKPIFVHLRHHISISQHHVQVRVASRPLPATRPATRHHPNHANHPAHAPHRISTKVPPSSLHSTTHTLLHQTTCISRYQILLRATRKPLISALSKTIEKEACLVATTTSDLA